MKNKKLLALNVVLGLLVVWGAVELNHRIDQASDRYRILNPSQPPKEPPSFGSPQAQPKVRPAAHMSIVQRLLFSEDRNPDVEVEPPPAPAPVVRPAFPRLAGVMELGEGPIALMSPDVETPASPVEVGEKVGEYIFLGSAGDVITLEWNGQKIEAHHAELKGGGGDSTRGRRLSRRRRGGGSDPFGALANSAPAKPKKPEGLGGKYNIGNEIRPGVYNGDPKDDSPAGTAFQGLVKRVQNTPFGKKTWWEKAR